MNKLGETIVDGGAFFCFQSHTFENLIHVITPCHSILKLQCRLRTEWPVSAVGNEYYVEVNSDM
jgi:hypothetical protein